MKSLVETDQSLFVEEMPDEELGIFQEYYDALWVVIRQNDPVRRILSMVRAAPSLDEAVAINEKYRSYYKNSRFFVF